MRKTILFLLLAMTLASCNKQHVHSLVFVQKNNPTCTEDGHEAYFLCSKCKRIFLDGEGQEELTSIPIIKATGHTYSDSYYFNNEAHWIQPLCDCGQKEEHPHDFNSNSVCNECGYNKFKPNLQPMEFLEHRIINEADFSKIDFDHRININEESVVIDQPRTYYFQNSTIDSISVVAENATIIFDNVVLNHRIISNNVESIHLFLADNSVNVCNDALINFNGKVFIDGRGTLKAGKYGSDPVIKSKAIFIRNAALDIDKEGDVLWAHQYVYFDSVTANMKATTIYVENNEANKERYGLVDEDFVYKIVNDISYGRGDYSSYAPIHTAKGIFVEGDEGAYAEKDYLYNSQGVYIKDSTLHISAGEDSIFSQFGYIDLNSSNIYSSSLSNGLRAKTFANLNKTTFQSTDGYEAIEAGQVQCIDSTIVANTFDDCIEASSNKDGYGNVIISSGNINVRSELDDGIDTTNIGRIINGAEVNAFGVGYGEGFDCDNGFIIDDGKAAAYSKYTTTEFLGISDSCIVEINCYPNYWESNKNLLLKQKDSDAVVFAQYIDFSMGNVVFSSNMISVGNTYSLYLDDDLIVEFLVTNKIIIVEI